MPSDDVSCPDHLRRRDAEAPRPGCRAARGRGRSSRRNRSRRACGPTGRAAAHENADGPSTRAPARARRAPSRRDRGGVARHGGASRRNLQLYSARPARLFGSAAGCATAAARDNILAVVDSGNPFPDKQLRLTNTHGHTRGPGYRSPPHHRDDAARPVGQPRRLADARLAARVRSTASGIAHFVEHMLFKGTGDADRRRHRAGDRLDRRPARRVHREGIRQLLHQGARRAPADSRSTSCPTS